MLEFSIHITSILKIILYYLFFKKKYRFQFVALLNPRQFGLVTETPSNTATRSLIMIAKCLQNLANLVEFGGKVIKKAASRELFQLIC